MKVRTFHITAGDGAALSAVSWHPATEATTGRRVVVLLVHGMAEHKGRYGGIAEALVNHGHTVYSYDQRGHGETAGISSAYGFVSARKGWEVLSKDLKAVMNHVRDAHPDAKLFALGHSMGSYVLRSYLPRRDVPLPDAVMLSGTGGDPGMPGRIGVLLARLVMLFRGSSHPSPLLNSLVFGAYNKQFEPARTAFDWLSRDQEEVDRYIEDPACGFVCASSFYKDLAAGAIHASRKAAYEVPSHLPVYIFSGDRCPVGANGEGPREVYRNYVAAGVHDIALVLYPGGRHEMLHEVNRQQVFHEIARWIDARSGAAPGGYGSGKV